MDATTVAPEGAREEVPAIAGIVAACLAPGRRLHAVVHLECQPRLELIPGTPMERLRDRGAPARSTAPASTTGGPSRRGAAGSALTIFCKPNPFICQDNP